MTALPAVVLAHQHGMSAKSYARQTAHHPVTHQPPETMLTETRPIDRKYELRRIWDLTGRTYRRLWTAWYIGGTTPYRIYDVQGSTVPEEVLGDLMAWIAEDHQHMQEDA
jgi:hypothetical protein